MQKLSAGYNNLLVHVFSQHPEFKEEIRRGDNRSRLSKCYSKKANNIYKCIEWIVTENREHRLSPGSLEENIFLYVNKRFWYISVVHKIITRG